MWQMMAPVPPDESVLPAGGDIEAGTVLRRSGLRMRASDIAVLTAAGVVSVSIRQPLIRIVNTRPGDAILDSAAAFLARAVAAAGARVATSGDLDDALRNNGADAILGIGGTGSGRKDSSVIALSRAGTVTCHGIGLAPGETSAFGTANDRPVLLMPGRIDSTLACWLVLGRAMIDRLGGAQQGDTAVKATLRRKVTSSIGIAEIVPLRHDGDGVEPLGFGYLPLRSLARADGWMLVPAASEGYPAGTEIEMRPLP
jgi:molybdopterin biosynthesis enzyme